MRRPELFRSLLQQHHFEHFPHQSSFATYMPGDDIRYGYFKAPHAEFVFIDDGSMIRDRAPIRSV